MKSALGINRTPPGSQRMWPVSSVSEDSSLRRLDVATAKRNATLIDMCNKDALARGSNGDRESADSTVKRSHDGTSLRTGGRVTNIPFTSCPRAVLSETVEPSEKPLWTAAMADR